MTESKDIIQIAKENIKGKDYKIVFPEGIDERIQRAAVRLKKEELLIPILLGDEEEIAKKAKENDLDLTGIEIINPQTAADADELIDKFVERRKGKNTREEGEKLIKGDPNYYGTMLVQTDKAQGMVSGAIHPTGDTVRPALQIIKTKPGVKRVSGAMFMIGPKGEKLLFADTAINITLDAEGLAEVAYVTAQTAKNFGIEPNVALLSFSTKGSASHELQEKVAEATKIAKEKYPDLNVDGELQFDAAIAPEVAALKAPGSNVAGKARVFIFPDLQSGNIGYKIGQRLGYYQAIGPILQGINKPVNDLSRGSSEDDAYKLAILTANQIED